MILFCYRVLFDYRHKHEVYMKKKILPVYVTEDDHKLFKQFAKSEGETMSRLISTFIKSKIKGMKK